jgi:hypothetical protein
METGIGFGRTAALAAAMAGALVTGGFPAGPAGATASPDEPSAEALHLAGTWGACGSWWTETATESSSGSVCGVDGLVARNGALQQLAEPLITVSRYTCFKGRRNLPCTSETFQGSVRRAEMTVDPFLRRATIRGTLGGCALDVEYVAAGQPQSQGNLSEWNGGPPNSPQISVSGGQTYTTQAGWWGGVCGQMVVPPPDEQGSQGWIFRGVEAAVGGASGQDGC